MAESIQLVAELQGELQPEESSPDAHPWQPRPIWQEILEAQKHS